MKIEDLQNLSETLFPYSFGAEKRVVDAKRNAFIKGVQHRDTKTFFNVHTISNEAVEAMVKILNDPNNATPHKLVSRVKYKSHFIACLTSGDEKLHFSIYDDGGFELHRGEIYSTAQQLELNSKAVWGVYQYLTNTLGYEIV